MDEAQILKELAVVQVQQDIFKEDITEIKDTTEKIYDVLNGKNGVVTKSAVNASEIKDNQNAINWLRGFVATLIICVLGIVLKAVW